MSVHYKFASGKESHTVTFDSLHISVADLKKAIMQQRKIGKSVDMDLRISNAQTKEVYDSDSALIPKNTSVIVARVPVSDKLKKSWYGYVKSRKHVRRIDQSLSYYPFRERHDNSATLGTNSPSHIEVDKITKSSNLSTSYASEDEKIKAMMSQSTQEYDPSKYIKNKGIIGPLPSNYTCYRCGQPGHYIKQCPTNNSDVKRSTGIPRSFMIPASADQKGALLTASGEYAVPIIDHQAYKEVKKEKPPFLPNSEDKELSLAEIPEDLKCSLCFDLLQDAVLIPCCGNSYCDECVRTILLESENHQCPTCQETNVSPDTLIPNRYLRISVAKFKNDTGYSREKFAVNKTDVQNGNDKQQNDIENASAKVDELSVNSDELESKVESPQQSPQNDANSDVTMDEVILGSPKAKILTKIEEVSVTPTNDEPEDSAQTQVPIEQIIEPINECNDSQPETSINTGSNTPLVDEPPDSYELNEDNANEQNEVNTINTIPQYQAQPLLTMPAYLRPPRMTGQIRPIRTTMGSQQSNPGLLGRPPILQVPQQRNMFARHGMAQDGRFYGPMRDPRGFPMGMGPVPPYAYQQPMRPPAFHDPYGYMGPRTHLPSPIHHPIGMHQSMAEAPPPGSHTMMSDNMYPYAKPDYDDYEDRVNRFMTLNESRPTKRLKRRSASRSRSRSHSRSSRSRSSSGSSSSSSSTTSRSSRFSFSSSSFSGSNRSPSYTPRRRSRSRSRYRRRSRSKSRFGYRDNYRYRRSRSPHHYEPQRRQGRRAYDADREREFRGPRTTRYEPNETSYRSSRRSHERSAKDSKQKYSSHCSHKSSEKSRNREKHTDSNEASGKRSGKTSQKDETDKADVSNEDNNNALITDLKTETEFKDSSGIDVNETNQIKTMTDDTKDDKGIKECDDSEEAVKVKNCDERMGENEDKTQTEKDRDANKDERNDSDKPEDKKIIKNESMDEVEEKDANEKRRDKDDDINDDNDDPDKADKRKDREKSKKHHKHHHHHHHRHRKASDDSKHDKVSDESKESSKRKHRKDSKNGKASDDKKKHKKESKNVGKGTDDSKASNDKKHKKESKNGKESKGTIDESKASSNDKRHKKESRNEKNEKGTTDESKSSKDKKHKHKSIVIVKRF